MASAGSDRTGIAPAPAVAGSLFRTPGLAGPVWLAILVIAALPLFRFGLEGLAAAWARPEFSHGPVIPILSFWLFLRELKAAGLYEDAVLVFIADHGEEFQDHGLWLHGRSLFDELIRVVDALQKADSDACATGADWRPGDKIIVPPTVPTAQAREQFADVDEIYPYLRFASGRK